MRLAKLLIILNLSVLPATAFAEYAPHVGTKNVEVQRPEDFEQPYLILQPYIPPTWDYGVELGSLWHRNDHYWLGLSVGKHVGMCLLVDTETCQQYIDVIGGVAGRYGYTHYNGLLSLRWQYVNFPKYVATFVRAFGGLTHSIEPGQYYDRPVYGVGVGVTTFLHPKADLRLEARYGMMDGSPWGQAFLSIQFRLDKVVSYFADRIKDVGVGTAMEAGYLVKGAVKTTGKVLEKTAEKAGQATGLGTKEKASPKPEASPAPSPTPLSSPLPGDQD